MSAMSACKYEFAWCSIVSKPSKATTPKPKIVKIVKIVKIEKPKPITESDECWACEKKVYNEIICDECYNSMQIQRIKQLMDSSNIKV